MNDRITIISAPDDSLEEAIRILLFDLDNCQYSIFSQALLSFDSIPHMIIYHSDQNTNISWILDKVIKSELIFFNAESKKENIIGYLCSKTNSNYFGVLRDLALVNKSMILDVYQIQTIIQKQLGKYGK